MTVSSSWIDLKLRLCTLRSLQIITTSVSECCIVEPTESTSVYSKKFSALS